MWINMTAGYIAAGVQDMFEHDKTPALFYFAFQPELWKEADMFFSFGYNTANNFTGLVRWILEDWEASGKTGRPKLGYVYWRDLPHGTVPLDLGVDGWAEEHGVDFVRRGYSPMPLDLRPILLGMRDEKVDYLYFQGVVGDVVVMIRDARAAGLWGGAMKVIIDATVSGYDALLPIVGEDAEGLYQMANNEPYTSGPSDAIKKQLDIYEHAGHSPKRVDGAAHVAWKEILTATLRQAVADVGYENLNGEAMYNALLKLGPMDRDLTGFNLTGFAPDKKMGQSGIIMLQYRKMAPGSAEPPDGIMMETVAVSDWIETVNIFEGEW
jgi:hypothetical protein